MPHTVTRPALSRPAAPLLAALATLAAVGLAGCGSDTTAPASGPAPVASVAVAPDSATLTPGDTVRLAATPKDAAGTALPDRAVSWTSSDTAIATVSTAGLVTARAEGSATITAMSEAQAGQATITVSPTPVATVAVSPDSTALYVGDTVRASATTLGAQGDTLTGRVVAWSSSDTTIARVDSTGLLTARAAGTATVTATSEGQRDSVVVTVTRVPVASVVVSPDNARAIVGDTLRLVATVLDVRGDTVTDRAVTWISSDATIATVDTTGLLTVYTPDTVTITATVEGHVDSATFPTVRRFAQLMPGSSFSCGLSPMGVAYCWGDNAYGELGTGTTTPLSPMPLVVAGGHTFTQLDAGVFFACGLTAAGTAYCWGSNGAGQLGDGTTTDRTTPTPVTGGLTFTELTAGNAHTCGLTTDGTAYCWGSNVFGQLGDSTTTNSRVPVAVKGNLTFTQLTAGTVNTCGLVADGTAYCWGDNSYGQLGDGTTTGQSSIPVAVAGGFTFTQLTAGNAHICGLTATGAAYCWGDNQYGQLGDGTMMSSPTPVPVTAGYTFTQLAAGPFQSATCGIDASGAASCWGDNGYGQLGDGSTTSSATPVAVAGGHVFATLSASYYMACGLATDGLTYCWGWNNAGQLGDGTTTDQTTPVLVAGQQ